MSFSGLFLFNGPAPAVTMALVSDTGSSLKDKISSNPAVKGIGQVNSAVTITEGSAVLGTTTTNGSGTWSFTPIGLADGAHTFTATQTDLAGNTVTAMLSFTLDTTAPMVSFGLVSDTWQFGKRRDHVKSGDQGHRRRQHGGDH